MKSKILIMGALILFATSTLTLQQTTPPNNWDAWKFLLGKWVGEGMAEVGKGGGYFTFESDLQGKILVRRNHSEYPATADRPAYVHDDLMVVFRDPATRQTRAFFTDNEGHAINYAATISTDGNTITFVSDIHTDAPRYRFIYVRGETGHMTLTLEMAPPGKPEEFRKLVEGSVRKVADHV